MGFQVQQQQQTAVDQPHKNVLISENIFHLKV